jgi:YegS/Rv2252/BmrU family lipid kinase
VTDAVLITNPHASRVEHGALDRAVRYLREGGLRAHIRRTAHRGHGADLAREAVADGARLVIAHGGDGTIMEVAAGLVGSGVPLGLLPAGTGNRLADNLGIGWSGRDATAIILAGKRRALDLGRLTTSDGARYFAVTAGCGFDAELMHRTDSALKRELGVGAYVAAALGMGRAIPRAQVRVETENGTVESAAAMILVANCGGIIPLGSPMAPQIRPDDGFFDILLVDVANLAHAARVGLSLVMGDADRDTAVTIVRGIRVAVTAEPAMPAQADGEPHGTTPFAAEMVPGGLTVLAPPTP